MTDTLPAVIMPGRPAEPGTVAIYLGGRSQFRAPGSLLRRCGLLVPCTALPACKA